MPSHNSKLVEKLVARMKATAQLGTWDGRHASSYFRSCRHRDRVLGVMAIFTRDVGHHSSGWWKNPEYEQCLHLSLSFFDPLTVTPAPRNDHLTKKIIAAVFGDEARKLWCEPPTSTEGKQRQVWHYRLFTDPMWQPIKPRGEVYSRTYTAAGWKSYSDVQAEKTTIAQLTQEIAAESDP